MYRIHVALKQNDLAKYCDTVLRQRWRGVTEIVAAVIAIT